jgi:hypothetical protein
MTTLVGVITNSEDIFHRGAAKFAEFSQRIHFDLTPLLVLSPTAENP